MVLSEDKVQSVFVLSEDKVQSTQHVEGDVLCLGCTYTFTHLVIYSSTLSMNID